MKVLVTGGAGYIGSFTIKALKEAGYEPVIFDSLETGHAEAVEGTKIYQGNLRSDLDLLDEVFKKEHPEAVIHFAAYIEVGESVLNPQKYFANNVLGSMNLLKAMLENNVLKIVFSSTAAVYGEPKNILVEEDDPKEPTNPYGESKLIIEKILTYYAKAYKFSVVALRYFNAAGAALDGSMGQDYPKPTHLITRACEAFLGKNNNFAIFGNDYATLDGTCIRDYIHVLDLASAHLAALKSFDDMSGFRAYNVGASQGYSVLEVINFLKKVSGIDKEISIAPRREGDPSKLTAGIDKIRKELSWEPKYSDLETIIKSSWLWHKNHPNGFKDQK